MKIGVFGAGYVGLVTSACFAEMGNSVVCMEIDAERVAALQRGETPIYEPGLETLIRRNVAAERLVFTADTAQTVAHGTLLFIAVGTPPDLDGAPDLRGVLGVAQSIGRHMRDYKLIINKSTVPVGTADRVKAAIAQELALRRCILPFAVVSNPEFLKEGSAVEDFMRPDRVIVGSGNEQATLLLRALYAPFLRNTDRMLTMDVRSAELAKYAANAMLATRISFINEIARVAEELGADIESVRRGIGSDKRIGTHFLYAGCGWGGSCFPKDIDALVCAGTDAGVDMSILRAVRKVNEHQKNRLVQRVVERFGEDLRAHSFALWGLAFKPGTDDMREAPSIRIVEQLVARGATVCAFDPAAMERARTVFGSNAVAFVDDPLDALAGASALLVVTEWREFRSPDFAVIRERMRYPVIFDGRNLYDPSMLAQLGFEYVGIGRQASGAAMTEAEVTALAA
ncbi:MAG TPA: UDP-glucose/GDP-mannose dehydrogenase family protein [Burkholderiaceae bacterium]|nr:UDP-glucose/GDP-mannose dehydrogenase family protein [Burkholderiaceae bacterium]